MRDITILRRTEDVFFGRRVRSVGFCNAHIAEDISQPVGVLIIYRHTNSTVHFIGIVIDTRSFKCVSHTLKVCKLHRNQRLVSVISRIIPHSVAECNKVSHAVNLLFLSLMFYCFWDTTKHIIPVFICIGSDNTLHVGILLLQTLGKIIACGIVVGAKGNILRGDIVPEHRVKDNVRLHAHHGNEPAIGQFLIVHLQI